MSKLDFFSRYIKKDPSLEIINKQVWSYTRVSSKEQFENNSSINRQKEANEEYAQKNGYSVVEHFGGTYESAKSDFTRKEFSRLIEKVQGSKKKPYAILVYKMSRFSRSGGNAIGLVNHLVEEQGVHLIEVSTGLNTISERGRAAIYESLFHAFKENLERKEIIIPNMKAYLKKGNRFGQAPFGYDHFGPRVRKGEFLSKEQRVVLNDDGKLLREAWQWKLSGLYSDAQILAKLRTRGLCFKKQHLSNIWRNPFYCGILINNLSKEPIKGKWEPIISESEFIRTQAMLENNHAGYQQSNVDEMRPLSRTLKCKKCNCYLVGYINKQKGLHYYRCLNCNGVSLTANTKPKIRKKSAEQLFLDLLEKYKVPDAIAPLVELQVKKIFEHYNGNAGDGEEQLNKQHQTLEKQLKELRINRGLNKIDEETFAVTKGVFRSRIAESTTRNGKRGSANI
jgi:DNA invertase Pin-like site-specific DNA recombinase